MKLIDAHAHNYYNCEKELEHIDDMSYIIENGVDSKTNDLCLNLHERFGSKIKVALGFHPTCITSKEEYTQAIEEINRIKELVKQKKFVVAIGEIGLDYYHTKELDKQELQKKAFIEYLKLAESLKLPVIIHARNAVNDVLDLLKNFKGKVVMHCLEASEKNILECIKRNYFFTVPASVERNELFQRLVKLVPVSKILTETDAPYQGPIRGENAKPKDVIYAIKYIAKEKELVEEEVMNIIYMNYNKVF